MSLQEKLISSFLAFELDINIQSPVHNIRTRALKEFENFDRKWNHVPIYAYGPFDNACWDIKGKIAEMPVYKMLGAAREEIPVYVSSGVLPTVDAYVAESLDAKAKGYRGQRGQGPSGHRRPRP